MAREMANAGAFFFPLVGVLIWVNPRPSSGEGAILASFTLGVLCLVTSLVFRVFTTRLEKEMARLCATLYHGRFSSPGEMLSELFLNGPTKYSVLREERKSVMREDAEKARIRKIIDESS